MKNYIIFAVVLFPWISRVRPRKNVQNLNMSVSGDLSFAPTKIEMFTNFMHTILTKVVPDKLKLVWGLSDVATTNVSKVDSKYWNTIIVRDRLIKNCMRGYFRGGFISMNFENSSDLAKISSNENIRKITKLTPRECSHLVQNRENICTWKLWCMYSTAGGNVSCVSWCHTNSRRTQMCPVVIMVHFWKFLRLPIDNCFPGVITNIFRNGLLPQNFRDIISPWEFV